MTINFTPNSASLAYYARKLNGAYYELQKNSAAPAGLGDTPCPGSCRRQSDTFRGCVVAKV